CSWVFVMGVIWTKKRWAAKPTSRCGRAAADESSSRDHYRPRIYAGSRLDEQRDRPVVHEVDPHASAEPSSLRAEAFAHPLVQRLGRLGWRGVDEARPVPLARVAVERELADAQDLAARVDDRHVHAPFG